MLSACAKLCPTLQPMDCSPPDSSVHGIFPATILECVAIFSSRGSSPPRDQTRVSCIVGQVHTLSLNCIVTPFPHLSGIILLPGIQYLAYFSIMNFSHFLVVLEGRLYPFSGLHQFIWHLASFVSRKRMVGTDFSLQSPVSLQISGSLVTPWLQISGGFKWKPWIWSFSSGKDALFSFSHFLRPEASFFFF